MKYLLVLLIILAACTPIPEIIPNITTQENPTLTPTTNTTITTNLTIKKPYLEEEQPDYRLRYNLSRLTHDNCQAEQQFYTKELQQEKRKLRTLTNDLEHRKEKITQLGEELASLPANTDAWEKVKKNYDKENEELDLIQRTLQDQENIIENMEYTFKKIKEYCLKAEAS
ncbi:MAG: hypothetical protein Q7R56_02105 [Nanoarchaeota archaeon]|nr:hypothetical protein [Nanoarchaeota archaeon]